MEYTELGKTGLRVSVAGLGCGGFSRIGLKNGASPAESIALVRQALELGVTLLDTAEDYGTEEVVGKALAGWKRDAVVLSTKAQVKRGQTLRSPEEVVASLDGSLKRLAVDHIDVFHLHGVPPWAYDHALTAVVPALLREKEKGKFRFLGITEVPPADPMQETLSRAVLEDCFEVVMVAFHMLHQGARRRVFAQTMPKGIGTLIMFAVRVLFSQPGRLRQVVAELVAEGKLPAQSNNGNDPLDFLLHDAGASSVIDAAYRFCRHEPGCNVVLFGTGNPDHLRTNLASILAPPLPVEDVARLRELFGALEGIGLDAPNRSKT